MGVRNAVAHVISAWRGLNSFISRSNADEQTWVDSNNVLVNARGEAEVLRSPKTFGNAFTGTHSFTSMDEFQRKEGNLLFIDFNNVTYSLPSTGGAPLALLGPYGGGPFDWTSLSINNTFQRVAPGFFEQFIGSDPTVPRANGIVAPTSAPVLSYVVNGADTTVIATSLQGSFAFMNSTTGHVGQPSPLSNILGPKAAGFDVRFAVTFLPAQGGVDKLVFFLTVDGGSVPYLIIDLLGDAVTHTAATANYDFNQSGISRDTLTPEPIYNGTPLLTATSMFGWKDRIFLVVDGGLQYSGFESCYIGNPWESWPPLNQLNVPNRNDRVVGGLSTQAGALIFGQKDCYLLTGYPSDKVVSPNNLIAVTEHIEPLNWNIGITYPKTAVNTPFGAIWVDQTRRVRLWNQNGFPSEIAEALRNELDAMTGALKARWFQHGKNGGYYVLTNGTITLFIMVFPTTNSTQPIPVGYSMPLQFGYGKSTTIAPEGTVTATFDNVERFFFAKTSQMWEILNPDVEGGGWSAGTDIFFKTVVGGRGMNFSTLHSVQVSGALEDLTLTHAALPKPAAGVYPDETDLIEVELSDDLESDTGGSVYGIVDSDERRFHVMEFSWGIDDRKYRNVDGFTANIRDSGRPI